MGTDHRAPLPPDATHHKVQDLLFSSPCKHPVWWMFSLTLALRSSVEVIYTRSAFLTTLSASSDPFSPAASQTSSSGFLDRSPDPEPGLRCLCASEKTLGGGVSLHCMGFLGNIWRRLLRSPNDESWFLLGFCVEAGADGWLWGELERRNGPWQRRRFGSLRVFDGSRRNGGNSRLS